MFCLRTNLPHYIWNWVIMLVSYIMNVFVPHIFRLPWTHSSVSNPDLSTSPPVPSWLLQRLWNICPFSPHPGCYRDSNTYVPSLPILAVRVTLKYMILSSPSWFVTVTLQYMFLPSPILAVTVTLKYMFLPPPPSWVLHWLWNICPFPSQSWLLQWLWNICSFPTYPGYYSDSEIDVHSLPSCLLQGPNASWSAQIILYNLIRYIFK